MVSNHRTYAPATALGSNFDFGIETALVKLSPEASQGLESIGADGLTSAGIPMPMVRFLIRKGFGDRLDFSVTGLTTKFLNRFFTDLPFSFTSVGAGIKGTLFAPEEGPHISIEMNYNWLSVSYVDIHSLMPAIRISRKLGIVDPYLGVAAAYYLGKLTYTIDLPSPLLDQTIQERANAWSANTFIGLSLQVGFSFAFEMGYDFKKSPWLATRFGFAF